MRKAGSAGLPAATRYRTVAALERVSFQGVSLLCWQAQEMCVGSSSTSTLRVRSINTQHWSTGFLRLAPSVSFKECEVCLSHLSQLSFTDLEAAQHLWLLKEQNEGDDISYSLPPAVHRGPSDAVDSVMGLNTRCIWW